MSESCIRWAGSKKWFVEKHAKLLPPPAEVSHYVELFPGGASVFAGIYGPARVPSTLLDANEDIIVTYRALRDHVSEVLRLLRELAALPWGETTYYGIRDSFNAQKHDVEPTGRAAWFLYLNRACMNGLCRYNQDGGFNVPIGKTASGKPPTIVQEAKLRAFARILAGVTLRHGDFALPMNLPARAFVYLDPPFEPLSATADFTSYTAEGFTYKVPPTSLAPADIDRVDVLLDEIHAQGARFALAQADTSAARARFRRWDVTGLLSPRSINSKGDGRGAVGELLVRNYR